MKTVREELQVKLLKTVRDRLLESLKKKNELDAMMAMDPKVKPDQKTYEQALKNYREFMSKLSLVIDHGEPYSETIALIESYNKESKYSGETVPWLGVVFPLLGSFALIDLHEKKDRWEAVHGLVSDRLNLVRSVYPGLESLIRDLKNNLYADLRKICEDAIRHPEKYSKEEKLVEKAEVKIGGTVKKQAAASSSDDLDDQFSQIAGSRHGKTESANVTVVSQAKSASTSGVNLMEFNELPKVGAVAGGRKQKEAEVSVGEVLQKVGGCILRNKFQEIPLYLDSLSRLHNKEIIRQLLSNRYEQFHKKEESDDAGLYMKTLSWLMLDLSSKRQGMGGSAAVIEEFMESTSRWELDKKVKLVTHLLGEMRKTVDDLDNRMIAKNKAQEPTKQEQKLKQMFEVLVKALEDRELAIHLKLDMPKK